MRKNKILMILKSLLEKISPPILLFMLVVILFWPILFSTKLLPGFDPLLLFYPLSYHNLYQQSFWAKTIFSGFDTWALPAAGAGNWLYYFLAPGAANFLDFISFYHLIIFFYVILALTFSYLTARQIGFDKLVASLVSSAYIFSAYNLSWMVNVGTGASLFIFPALVYFLLKFENTLNWRWPVLGGVFLALGLAMSHLQFALIAVFGGFLFSLFLVFNNGFRRPKWIFLAAISIIFSIGIALASPELLSEYRLTQLTARELGLGFAESQECALGIFDFARYLVPSFSFGIVCGTVLYIGILPLILAILAIFYLPNRKQILFWISLLVFAVLFSVKYSPLAWLFHYLPIWKSLRGPDRFTMLANFSWAVLAGFGFNWILSTYGRSPEGRENKNNFHVVSKIEPKEFKIFLWLKRIFFGFAALIITVNIFGLFKTTFIKWARDYFDKYYYQKTTGLPLEHYHKVIENMIDSNFYAFSLFNKDFIIPFILAALAVLTVIFVHKFNRTALFYVFMLSGFIWAVTSPMVSSGPTRDFFKETEIVRFLKQQEGVFRIYSLLPGLAAYQMIVVAQNSNQNDETEFFKAMLPVNLNLVFGLDSIDGLETSIPRRASGLLSELLSERSNFGNKIADARLKPEEKIKIFESRANVLAMMNVKYIISAFPLSESVFKKVFETKVGRFGVPIYIYENKGVLPRFYFAKSVKRAESDEKTALKQLLEPNVDFKAATLIECEDNCGGASSGKIIDYEYKNGYLRLNTESQTGGWIIFSESFSPYWSAKVNNESAPIYQANYVYQAVRAPAGDNMVEFTHEPKFFIGGNYDE